MADNVDAGPADTLTLTAEIVSSYLSNASHVNASEIPSIIKNVRVALSGGATPAAAPEPEAPTAAPKMHAATVRKSITPDALISFIDNKPYKTLKRHLARHGHDMASYRQAFGLPKDYPSVASSYSAARSEMARKLGLGARGRTAGGAAESETVANDQAPAAGEEPPAPKRARKKAESAED